MIGDNRASVPARRTRSRVAQGLATPPSPIIPIDNQVVRRRRCRDPLPMEQPNPNQAQRIEALEHALGTEAARFRRHQVNVMRPFPAYSGELTESIDDFLTDVERYAVNNQIAEADIRNYLPDFLSGTAREFFRTLNENQIDTFAHLRTVFMTQFNSQARTQAALQQFYRADQRPNEPSGAYYCRLKALARAAFHEQDNAARTQQVAARMKQGLRPEIRRALIGQQFQTAEALRTTAEAVELELAATAAPAPATKSDIKALISAMKNTKLNGSTPGIDAIEDVSDEYEERQVAYYATAPKRQSSKWRPAARSNVDRERCFYCNGWGHRQRNCRKRQEDGARMRQLSNRGRGPATSRGHGRPAVFGRGRYGGRARAAGPSRPYGRVSTIQASDDWPRQEFQESDLEDESTGINQKKRMPKSALSWMFAVMLLLFITDVHAVRVPEHMGTPMLCQSHVAKTIYKVPDGFNCSLALLDEEPGPINATIRTFKRNVIHYTSSAYLCTRIEATVERLTYFAAVSHTERKSSRKIPVSAAECRKWITQKHTTDGELAYTDKLWATRHTTGAYWPSIFQCCRWHRFSVNNSFIFVGKVMKEHGHSMHSNLGDWRTCSYSKGQCSLRDGSQAIWQVERKEKCKYIPFQKVSGQLWGNSFLSTDQTLGLTFGKQWVTGCSGKLLNISHQGVPFEVLHRTGNNEEIKRILSRPKLKRRRKRAVNVTIGQSAETSLRVRVFNVSTDKVAEMIPYDLMEAPLERQEQHYLVGVNFYVQSTGEMLDREVISENQLRTKMHYYVRTQRRIYSVIFLKLTYQRPLICSFAVMIVKGIPETPSGLLSRQRRSTETTTDSDSEPSAIFWAAQLQAVAKYSERSVRHAYLQALKSTCSAMNNVLRITKAAVTEHPTVAARKLLNTSFIHARSSGHLLQVWPCAPVVQPRTRPMPPDMCSKRIPIKYTFLNEQHSGYLDTHTNIIFHSPQPTDCAAANNIPVIWNGTYQLYQRNGSMVVLKTIHQLHWTPFDDAALRLRIAAPTFRHLTIYNDSDFKSLAAEDMIAAAVTQARLLQDLGLTATNTKTKFAEKVVSFGLFSFLYGGIVSLVQLWIFGVCIVVSALIVLAIVYCCIHQCKVRGQKRYKTITSALGNTWLGIRLKK